MEGVCCVLRDAHLELQCVLPCFLGSHKYKTYEQDKFISIPGREFPSSVKWILCVISTLQARQSRPCSTTAVRQAHFGSSSKGTTLQHFGSSKSEITTHRLVLGSFSTRFGLLFFAPSRLPAQQANASSQCSGFISPLRTRTISFHSELSSA